MLPSGELKMGMIPGLSVKDVRNLKRNLVVTVDHLVGQFFLVDRDEKVMTQYLVDCGVCRENAEECAHELWKKFSGL
jgi:hypothetical protein